MKSNEKRSLKKPSAEISLEHGLSPLNRIPRKPRTAKDGRDRKRIFSSMSRDQLESTNRGGVSEEVAARELLRSKATGGKIKPPRMERALAPVPPVQDLARLIPALSGQDLTRLADSIKRRRLRMSKPTTDKPVDQLLPGLVSSQSTRPELARGTSSFIDSPQMEGVPTSKEEDTEDLEERLLQRLLDARQSREKRSREHKVEPTPVRQLADVLEEKAMRSNKE